MCILRSLKYISGIGGKEGVLVTMIVGRKDCIVLGSYKGESRCVNI